MSRNLKEEILKIKGGDLIKWYSLLSKLEKAEYRIILDKLSEDFLKK